MAKHQCMKALIDARELETNVGVTEVFRAGKDLGALAPAGLKVAIVASSADMDGLFEDTAANRGAQFAMFAEEDEAVKWLRSEE